MVKKYFLSITILCTINNYALEHNRAEYAPLKSGIAEDFGVTADVSSSYIATIAYLATLNKAGTLSQKRTFHKQTNQNNRPIFKYFSQLADSVPHITLGDLPTPVSLNIELSTHAGIPVWIKQDNLTGPEKVGKRLYGGNKVRKLEFLFAEALAHGAKEVATFGCVGSNHATATAVYAQEVGLKCTNFLKHQEPSPVVKQNLLTLTCARRRPSLVP